MQDVQRPVRLHLSLSVSGESMTHATLNKATFVDFTDMDVDKSFAELAADLTAPRPEKAESPGATITFVKMDGYPYPLPPVTPQFAWKPTGVLNAGVTVFQGGDAVSEHVYGYHDTAPLVPVNAPPAPSHGELKRDAARYADAAAGTIERYGWIQGSYGGPGVGFCALGALSYVTNPMRLGIDHARAAPVFGMISKEIRTRAGWPDVASWNDMAFRTKAEVVGMFRAVAAGFRA